MPSNYIVFEGIDGSGKDTQQKMLCEKLSNLGIPFEGRGEPSAGPIGRMIRNDYLSGLIHTHQLALQALFVADRLDHVLNVGTGIKQRLEAGINIIQVRGYLSGLAYGSASIKPEAIEMIHEINIRVLRPTVTIWIDIDPGVGLSRIASRKGREEIFDGLEKQKKIKERYLHYIEKLSNDGEKFIAVDGNRPSFKVHEYIWKHVAPLFLKSEDDDDREDNLWGIKTAMN